MIILDNAGYIKNIPEVKERTRAIAQTAPNHIALQTAKTIDKEFLKHQNLMLLSLESWKNLVESKSLWLSDIPSALIIDPKD